MMRHTCFNRIPSFVLLFIAGLATLLLPSANAETPGQIKTQSVSFAESPRQIFHISSGTPVFQRMIFENTTSQRLGGLWIVVNGKDWSDNAGVAQSIRNFNRDVQTMHQKIMSVWAFMDHYYYHSSPPMENFLYHDAKFNFNNFGYGFCDSSACIMEGLVVDHLRYLPQSLARTAWLSGHVVPEFYYDNQWHSPDADIVYYSTPSKEALSVEELAGEFNALIKSVLPERHGNLLANVYATTENNRYGANQRQITPTLRWELKPGDRVEVTRQRSSQYYAFINSEEIPRRLSGGKIYSRPTHFFPRHFETAQNVKLENMAFVPKDSATTATMVFRIDAPYVLTDGVIQFRLPSADLGGLRVALAHQPTEWIAATPQRRGAANEFAIGIARETNIHRAEQFCRTMFVKMEWPAGCAVEVLQLIAILDFQIATMSLPELRLGANDVWLKSDAPLPLVVEMEYLQTDRQLAAPPNAGWLPEERKIVWDAPHSVEHLKNFRVTISSDPSALWPVQPLVTRRTFSPDVREWRPDLRLLNPGRTYYFTVDAIYDVGGAEILCRGMVGQLKM